MCTYTYTYTCTYTCSFQLETLFSKPSGAAEAQWGCRSPVGLRRLVGTSGGMASRRRFVGKQPQAAAHVMNFPTPNHSKNLEKTPLKRDEVYLIRFCCVFTFFANSGGDPFSEAPQEFSVKIQFSRSFDDFFVNPAQKHTKPTPKPHQNQRARKS